MLDYSAVGAPGLEPVLAKELRDLGLGGGPGSLRDLYRANLLLRSADRVLVRMGRFPAHAFPELRRKASRLAWKSYLKPGQPVVFRVHSQRSRLYHESAVAERMAGAIADSLGAPPQAGKDGQLIDVRLESDLCTISLDSSGAPLHKRGYRLATGKAPLRESVAAGIVLASGWDRRSPLLDPFCGSGTIPIEAALLAKNIAPGRGRRFAFMDWPVFDRGAWEAVCAQAEKEEAAAGPKIMASDRDSGAIRAAQDNARRAGVAGCIEFSCRAVSAVEPPPGPGWVVTNPPYGVRLRQSNDIRDLYAQFGRVLRAQCPGWHVSVLSGGPRLMSGTGLSFAQGISTMNGGLPVRLASCLV
ncbi:MAG: class I SAM-dependent RNA methyltransferase [Elusimicrobia bacterium]|nr:class I SAM-dependent RNA methyltransferase [Elusimicrobiota bacterium]